MDHKRQSRSSRAISGSSQRADLRTDHAGFGNGPEIAMLRTDAEGSHMAAYVRGRQPAQPLAVALLPTFGQ